MTTRPLRQGSTKRPVSAIFLGSNSSSSSFVPDLPEPPSPGASSNDSGLPSPPATNSTGSGSVGDSAGSVRRKPTMFNGTNNHARTVSASSALDDVQDENEILDDEEHTAKFGGPGRRYSTSNAPADNLSALERVKSLAKRNQEALEKLDRLGTSSPVNGRSASVLSRAPTTSQRIASQPPRLREASGSETERESHHPDEQERATTPPSISQRHMRQRLISAPESPSKFRTREIERHLASPPRQPRKRASMMDQRVEFVQEEDDVGSAALAAVASSRRSPTGGRRTRQPLPQEFRDDEHKGQYSQEPTTPHRNRSVKIIEARRSPSPTYTRGSAHNSTTTTPVSPRPARTILRSATLRDTMRNKSMRSASDDISTHAYEDDPAGGSRMRRQSIRGGSAESSLANNRSLVGEGLRAAGIMKRRETTSDDVFREPFREPEERRTQASARGSSVSNDWDESTESDRARRAPKRTSLTMSRLSEDIGAPYETEIRTPASASSSQQQQLRSRPSTSMAGYHYDDSPSDHHRNSTLRAQKSSLPLSDRESSAASVRPSPRGGSQELGYSSPYGIQRQLAGTPLSNHRERVTAGDHGRLMLESLSIFESHLSRLPPMGNTTTSTIPELFRSAQTIVQATERLNNLLRNGTNRALEEQIGAEVDGELGEGNVEMSEHWRGVGSEFRDSLRVSDELVRNMTGFLLGVGKVLRDTSSSIGNQQQQHLRSVSMDDAGIESAHTSGGRSSEGRSAAGSRRSWDPVRREPEQRAPSREGVNSRPPSSFRGRLEETPPTATSSNSSASRRFLTSRERDSPVNGGSASRRAILDFQESLTMNDPSPTPASRQHQPATTRATLPALSVPRPLPVLPPAGVINHHSSDSESSQRKKMSTNSAATVRGQGGAFQPTLTTPSATTAITPHTVSFPGMHRTESSNSVQGMAAFSRPSTISISALNGLKQRESRSRVTSTNLNLSSADEQGNYGQLNSPVTATDRDREQRWRTVNPRTVRISMDGGIDEDYPPELMPEATSQTMRLPSSASSTRRERRRTITEIFAGS